MALDSGSLGLVTNLGIGITIFLAVLIIFDVLRYYLPGTYYYRESASSDQRYRNYDGTPLVALPRPSSRPFAWILPTLRYSEQATIATHGLDVAMYLRFLATQGKLYFLLTIFTAIVLYPTYITAGNRHLPLTDDRRPTGIAIASLANVPDKSSRLWVTLVSEIVIVATVLYFLHRDILTYTKYRRQYRSDGTKNPSNYAIIVQDIPKDSRSLPQIFKLFDSIFPGDIAAVHQVRDAEALFNLKTKYFLAVTKRERAEWDIANAQIHPASDITMDTTLDQIDVENNVTASSNGKGKEKSDPLYYWRQEEAVRRKLIIEKEDFIDEIAPLTGAAIVVFTSKRVASIAATTPIWSSAGCWKISRAAEPRGVNWNRLDITRKTTRIRAYISFATLTALALSWTLPATFIQALANFTEFAERYKSDILLDFAKNNPGFIKFLEGVLPPLLLFVALLLIPLIMRFIISFERIHNLALLESKIRNYLFFFYVMSNFIYVVVIGSVFDKLEAIAKNPSTLVSLLSTSVPAKATFIMKYVLINAFLGSTLGMLNIGRLLFRPFAMRNTRTLREKQKGDGLFAQYPFSKLYALCSMISLISLVYSTIAPVICLVAFAYYSIAYLCTKQLLLFSHRPLFEGGGFLFRDAWVQLLIGLYFHQVSMIGIFSLKLAIPQAILAGLSFIFSIWFTLYCRNAFWLRVKHGSLIDQLNYDEQNGLRDQIPDSFPDMYIHPGLKPLREFGELVQETSSKTSTVRKEA